MTNNFKLKHRSLILIILTSFYISNITAQTWLEKLDEVKLSLEKYNDCKTAERILQEIKSEAETEIMYKFYIAQVFKCKGDLEKYRDYLVEFNKIKEDPLIQDEIIDLNYQITKAKIADEDRYGFKDGIYVYYTEEKEEIEMKVETNYDKSNIHITNLNTGNFYDFSLKSKGLYFGTQTRLFSNIPKEKFHLGGSIVEYTQGPCSEIDNKTEANLEVLSSKTLKLKYLKWGLVGCERVKTEKQRFLFTKVDNSYLFPCDCTSSRKDIGWDTIILEIK